MAKKTVIKKALKYAPLRTEFVRAVGDDESSFDFTTDGDDYNIIQGKNPVYDESNIVDIDDGDVQVQEEARSGEKEPADKK